MKASSNESVRAMYDDSAADYDAMMDTEMELSVYADVLGRLAPRLRNLSGPVVDTSCGSGHMLARYHERHEPGRGLVGIDLSPRMAEIAKERLGDVAEVFVGDMRNLSTIDSGTAAAVISFFAIHHLDPDANAAAFAEWHRVLEPGGQLVLAAWEGTGTIDYGGAADITAFRYTEQLIRDWAVAAGFRVGRVVVEPVDGMEMDAVYLEATRQTPGED